MVARSLSVKKKLKSRYFLGFFESIFCTSKRGPFLAKKCNFPNFFLILRALYPVCTLWPIITFLTILEVTIKRKPISNNIGLWDETYLNCTYHLGKVLFCCFEKDSGLLAFSYSTKNCFSQAILLIAEFSIHNRNRLSA